MTSVVIVSAKRTPIGRLGGQFKDISAESLGTIAAKAAIAAAKIDPNDINQAIFGNVLQAGSGQNIARQIGLNAGLPVSSTATTVNEVCGSGLKAIRMGQAALLLGEAKAVLVGGTESMSSVPFYVPNMRFGRVFGGSALIDGLEHDGLTDAFTQQPMGITAENVAQAYDVPREAQDSFALLSHQKAKNAQSEHWFDEEIVPVSVKQKRSEVLITTDEGVRPDTSLEKLSRLKPAFKPDGTVTAGNASGLNDGAAALVLMTKEAADEAGLDYLAVIDDYVETGIAPELMGYAPKLAITKLLEQHGETIDDFDLVELNEAFAAQSVAVARDLGIDPARLNIGGGAIALGHPLGASGARIMTTLIHSLIRTSKQRGLASLCVGGGMGLVMTIHREMTEE